LNELVYGYAHLTGPNVAICAPIPYDRSIRLKLHASCIDGARNVLTDLDMPEAIFESQDFRILSAFHSSPHAA
jgi:hypothetical protein